MIRPVLAVVAVLALGGCGADTGGNAPVSDVNDSTTAQIIEMPEGFPNVAVKCLDTTGLYVSEGGDAVTALSDDPRCVGEDEGL